MKKIIFSLMTIGAMFLTTQNIQAQEDEEIPEVEEVTTQTDTAHTDFTEINVVAIPQAIKDALMTDYDGAVAKEAWVKAKEDKKVYKIKIDVKGQTEKVYADQDGNWLKEEDIESSEK